MFLYNTEFSRPEMLDILFGLVLIIIGSIFLAACFVDNEAAKRETANTKQTDKPE